MQRLWAASGVLTVVLFACGRLFGDVLGTTNFPPLDASALPLVLMVGVVAAETLRERILARWTGWLGVVAALCGAACASTLLGPTNNHSAEYGILLLGASLMFAWLVVTSIAFVARTSENARS